MKKLFLLATIPLLWTSFEAGAVTMNDYIALKGGYAAMKHRTWEQYNGLSSSIVNDWDGDAALGSVAYGLRIGYLRVEAEGSASTIVSKERNFPSTVINTIIKSRINAGGGMLNSYLELPVNIPLRPYISAGAGISHIKARFKNRIGTQESSVNFSKNHFAWQVGAGFTYEIMKDWAIDLGYRFVNYGKIENKIIDESTQTEIGKLRVDAKAYNAYIGLRYSF